MVIMIAVLRPLLEMIMMVVMMTIMMVVVTFQRSFCHYALC